MIVEVQQRYSNVRHTSYGTLTPVGQYSPERDGLSIRPNEVCQERRKLETTTSKALSTTRCAMPNCTAISKQHCTATDFDDHVNIFEGM